MGRGKLQGLGRTCMLGLLVLAAGAGGCTRQFFRNAADREVSHVLAQKDRNPFWRIEQFHVYPSWLSRFADPTNPDRPPMPPDDPAARDLSPNPQRPHRRVAYIEGTGYIELLAGWDAENRAEREATRQSARAKSSSDIVRVSL